MVFQEVLPVLLTPPFVAGAVFYILVYVFIEKMTNTSTKGAGAGPEIRSVRPEQGEVRNQSTEVDLTTDQLKERYV